MALIKCPECGREISDKAASCPNCGYPIMNASPDNGANIHQNSIPQQNNPQRGPILTEAPTGGWNGPSAGQTAPVRKKNTKLSIIALVFAILGTLTFLAPIAWIGMILCVIDFFKNKTDRKYPVLIIAVIISLLGIMVSAISSSAPDDSASVSNRTETEEQSEITESSVSADEISPETESATQPKETIPESEPVSEEASVSLNETKDEFIATCQEISYKTLLRTPDDYIGQRIIIVAKVQQILQGGWFDDNQYYRVQTDNDGYNWYMDDEYFMYDFRVDDNTKLLTDDVLKIYAEFVGLETVTRALTNTKEDVPAIKAYFVEIISE